MAENRVKSNAGNVYANLDDAALRGLPSEVFEPIATDKNWRQTYDAVWVDYVLIQRFYERQEFTVWLPKIFATHYKGAMSAQHVLACVYKRELDEKSNFFNGIVTGEHTPIVY